MNTASFVGNLTRDPDLRHSSNGKPRAVFTVAVNERWGDDNEQEKTHFLNVTAFGSIGENAAATLSKGDRVLVMGRIDSYDKQVADTDSGDEFGLNMISFTASALGPDLRFASADVTRNPKKGGNGSRAEGSADQEGASKSSSKAAAVADDDEF